MAVTRVNSTPVAMRVWNGVSGDIFALLPTIPADEYGRYCTSYQHVGQHGSAEYWNCMKFSRQATEEEYSDLLLELGQLGYSPVIVLRATKLMHRMRVDEAKRLRAQQ